ncbi:hypothetical protein HRbin40_00509 [bacterium HR40]|nr:hypothetical protein HRbin40_00509 [bacterium HR40]
MMRVLFTGGSSFTGAWFARALARAGCSVLLLGRREDPARDPEERERLAALVPHLRRIDGVPFGCEAMLRVIEQEPPFDLLCLHGATVGDHRAPGFDALAAATADTHGLDRVLDLLAARGLRAVLHTGSLFEADEGAGEKPLRPFSPYGLAKTLTWQVVRFACERRSLTLGKFVIGHPFGPYQKPGLCRSLLEAWLAGQPAVLRQPRLLRDHLPVELLAEAYARFAVSLVSARGTVRLVPTCYAEPLQVFAERLAREMQPRLGRPCRFIAADPPEPSSEPRIRFGLDPASVLVPGFDYEGAWDRLAAWAIERYGNARAMHGATRSTGAAVRA